MTKFSAQVLCDSLTIVDEDTRLIESAYQQAITTTQPVSFGFVNQHGFNLMAADSQIYSAFLGLDYRVRDGIGMKLALKRFGREPGANLNGTDLIPKFVRYVAKHTSLQKRPLKVFVFGTQEPWLSKGSEKLCQGLEVIKLDGFRSEDAYLNCLKSHQDTEAFHLIILAMGMPKQEFLAQRIRTDINASCLVLCGGAIIDFQAGRVKRAPDWIRKLSLEWAYRLMLEPKRLFKRYVFGIPLFFFNLFKFR